MIWNVFLLIRVVYNQDMFCHKGHILQHLELYIVFNDYSLPLIHHELQHLELYFFYWRYGKFNVGFLRLSLLGAVYQVPEFEEAAFSAPLNKVVGCKTKFGWHLLQVLSERWFQNSRCNRNLCLQKLGKKIPFLNLQRGACAWIHSA